MNYWEITPQLVLYVSLGTCLLCGLILVGMLISGTATPTGRAWQFVATVTCLSAFVLVMATLGVLAR